MVGFCTTGRSEISFPGLVPGLVPGLAGSSWDPAGIPAACRGGSSPGSGEPVCCGNQYVARMQVTVDKVVLEDHLEESMQPPRRQLGITCLANPKLAVELGSPAARGSHLELRSPLDAHMRTCLHALLHARLHARLHVHAHAQMGVG